MAQMLLPSRVKTTAWGGRHGSLALVLHDPDYSSITKAHVTSTKPVTQPDAINKGITATSTPLKILNFQEETKKLQRNVTCRRQSPTLVSNASSTASKNSKSKNSTKSILGTPTTPSKVFSTISEPTMVVPLCPSSQQGQRDSGHPAQRGAADGDRSSAKHRVGGSVGRGSISGGLEHTSGKRQEYWLAAIQAVQ